jgi:hypothetical protein
MSVLLAVVGGVLLFFAIRWKLKQIEAQAVPRTVAGVPNRGRSNSQLASRPKSSPRAAKSEEDENATLAKILRASVPIEEAPQQTERVLMKIPLEVAAKDLQGRPFTERTNTQMINRNTATLMLRHAIPPNAQMTIKNLKSGKTCRFRVRSSSAELPHGLREWGVELLDPVPNFWGISFSNSIPGGEHDTVGSLLECSGCHCREMTKLSMAEYAAIVKENTRMRRCNWCEKETEWKFVMVEEDAPAAAPKAQKQDAEPVVGDAEAERRRNDRRIARMPVSIRHQDGREELTVTENVSRTGICCAAKMELVAGDRVFLRLVSDQGVGQAEFRALLMWRRKMQEQDGILYGMRMERDAPRATAAR